MLRTITAISLSFLITSSDARSRVTHREVHVVQETSPDIWNSGNVDILEGLTVRRIMFLGNVKTPDSVRRRAFLIVEGNVLSRKGLARTLRRLNRLGRFETIREGDISWQKDDGILTSGEVDLIIRVKEKRRR